MRRTHFTPSTQRVGRVLLCGLAILFSGCHKPTDHPPPVEPRHLDSISVTPPGSRMAAGTRRAFVATALFDDGSTEDYTAKVTWSSSDGSKAAFFDDHCLEG